MAAFREKYLAGVHNFHKSHIFFINHVEDNTNNFKNICKNIAVRHQLNQFRDWRESVPRKCEVFPSGKMITVSGELILCFYPGNFSKMRSLNREEFLFKGPDTQLTIS